MSRALYCIDINHWTLPRYISLMMHKIFIFHYVLLYLIVTYTFYMMSFFIKHLNCLNGTSSKHRFVVGSSCFDWKCKAHFEKTYRSNFLFKEWVVSLGQKLYKKKSWMEPLASAMSTHSTVPHEYTFIKNKNQSYSSIVPSKL